MPIGFGMSEADILEQLRSPNAKASLAVKGTGILSETCSRHNASSATQVVSQRTIFGLLGLNEGDLVQRLHVWVSGTAASSVTTTKMGLYDKNGNRLAVTANDATAATATGAVTMTLATPYTVTSNDAYYVAFLFVGTTAPGLLRTTTSAIGAGFNSGVGLFGTESSQTDLDATATIVASNAFGVWAAVS